MLTALFRTLLLYLLIMVGLRLMGKRQIGELEPSELVLTMMISDLASVPMQDFGIPLLSGVLPIVTLLSVSMLLSWFSLKSLRFRKLLCGEPTILIKNGQLSQAAMAKNRFTLDELLEELRCQGISDLATVKYAVLENNGQLAVLPYSHEQPMTPKQAQQPVKDDVFLPILLINDGRVIEKNLASCGHDQAWLQEQLLSRHYQSPKEVFLFSLDESGAIACIPKEAGR